MHTPSGSVAVLLFSRSATAEARHKPLSSRLARAELVWQALERLTLAKSAAADLPVFVSHKLPVQQTGTFGDQLQQAAQAVLELGYSSVLCIGNDCPSLRPADLREAARLLEAGAIPVGIDKRGGVYLTGFTHQSLTDVQTLAALPWQTTSLAVALRHYLHQQGQTTVRLAARYADWNARADVRLSQATGQRTWLRQLAEAFRPVRQRLSPGQPSVTSCRAVSPSGLRAPPTGN
ncbi:DUF2064 domain-containing protein [Fibrella arboris]|uniref:DUF2064 domain-containing protein n=1 Tax=Fibrella arboris TaxID=3242486 RepID=UPI0035225263